MNRILTFLFLSLLWGSALCSEPDSTGVVVRMAQRMLPEGNIFTGIYVNPSNMLDRYESTLSTIDVSYDLQDADQAMTAGEGKGRKGLNINLATYVKLNDRSRAWGSASYSGYRRLGVRGNETSDYTTVYPYVMADTIGGDMKGEEYAFNGGYASASGAWRLGVGLSYRAQIEYRDIDPRPRNISHLINLTAGAGHLVGSNYVAGVSLSAARYRQNTTISFYNELGGHKVYHLTGMGTSYYRFDGSRYQAEFADWRYGASLQLMPLGNGLNVSAGYTHRRLGKSLPSNADITINELVNSTASVEVAYVGCRWGAGVYGVYDRRTGSDNIFGVSSGDIYDLISKADQWHLKAWGGGVKGYFTLPVRFVRLSALPGLEWHSWRESYVLPQMWRNASSLTASLNVQMLWLHKRDMVEATIGGFTREALSHSLNAPVSASPYFGEILRQDFIMMSGSQWQMRAGASWTHTLTSHMALKLGASAARASLPGGAARTEFTVSLGLVI